MDKTNKNANWQRLASVVRWSNMTINRFAIHIGLSRSENLYQIKNGNNGISQNLARRIEAAFPEISIGWLLTGEGTMLREDGIGAAISCYNSLESLLSLGRGEQLSPDCLISLPMADGGDVAVCLPADAKTESLESELLPAMTYFLKKTTIRDIIPSAKYMILTSNFVYLRKVMLSTEQDEPAQLTLLSVVGDALPIVKSVEQSVSAPMVEATDEVHIAQAEVVAIYQVVGLYSAL